MVRSLALRHPARVASLVLANTFAETGDSERATRLYERARSEGPKNDCSEATIADGMAWLEVQRLAASGDQARRLQAAGVGTGAGGACPSTRSSAM